MIRAGGLARKGIAQAADRPLLHDLAGGSLTGRCLLKHVDALAGALLERNLEGAKIGLWYRNSLPAVEAFLAVEWIGGSRLAVDPNAPAGEAQAIFEAAGVDIILADAERGDLLANQDVVVHDADRRVAGNPRWPALEVEADRVAILYPRAVQGDGLFAVPISYANWEATLQTSINLFRSGKYGAWKEKEECFVSCQQVMHGTGFLGTFPFLAMGLPQVIVDDFKIDRIADAVARHRATATMLVPVMLARLTEAANRSPAKMSSLTHVLYGGGKVELDDLRASIRALGPILSQVYGRFEGGWPISILDPQDHADILAGNDARGRSCGRVIDGVEVRLREVAGADRSRGELCVRSAAVVADYADSDGWCSLGDVMKIDPDGYLTFQARLDRMINTGYHIYPAEVENAIAAVPHVAEVLVVGEAHRDWGQTVIAYVVADAGGTQADELIDTIRRHLASRLARYKIPRVFHIVEVLPTIGHTAP